MNFLKLCISLIRENMHQQKSLGLANLIYIYSVKNYNWMQFNACIRKKIKLVINAKFKSKWKIHIMMARVFFYFLHNLIKWSWMWMVFKRFFNVCALHLSWCWMRAKALWALRLHSFQAFSWRINQSIFECVVAG